MTFREALREIESLEFAARLNVASNLRTFLRAAEGEKAVQTLLRELDSQEKQYQLLSRVLDLSPQQVNPRYENPWDTALAVYVWLIHGKDIPLAQIAAEAAAQAPQCWWAWKVSQGILRGDLTHSSAGVERHKLTWLPSTFAIGTPISDAAEATLFINFPSMSRMAMVPAHVSKRLNLQTSNIVTRRLPPQSDGCWVLPQNKDGHTMVAERLTP